MQIHKLSLNFKLLTQKGAYLADDLKSFIILIVLGCCDDSDEQRMRDSNTRSTQIL